MINLSVFCILWSRREKMAGGSFIRVIDKQAISLHKEIVLRQITIKGKKPIYYKI